MLKKLLLCTCLMAALSPVWAQSNKDILSSRLDRLNRSDRKIQKMQEDAAEIWSAQKVLANLEARVPVITTLGYLAAFDAGADKFEQLKKRLQPVAAEIATFSQQKIYVGTRFPDAPKERLAQLKKTLCDAVAELYGEAALKEVQAYAQAARSALYVE